MRACTPFNFFKRSGHRTRAAVGAIGGHCIKCIGDGNQSAEKRNPLAGNAVRVTAAAETFVMMHDAAQDVTHLRNATQDVVPYHWMGSDLLELFITQFARLAQHIFADTNLADVVHKTA